jgi:hypothetical protein
MPSDFHKVMAYIKTMQSRYHRALSAFYVYDTLVKLSAPNISGKNKAKENIKVINQFKDFFLISKEAVRVYFFLELAKMFDNSDQALQINKIVNLTESRIANLSAKDFEEYNKDRELVKELVKTYKGINRSDLQKIKRILAARKPIIKKLIIYRNKWLAHDDAKKPDLPAITVIEIKKLFEALSKIMNLLGSKINSETWMWSHVQEDSKNHTKLVIEYLRRFEPYRIKEIYTEAEAEMKKYNKMYPPK